MQPYLKTDKNTHDEITHNEVTHDEVTHDEITHNEITHNEFTYDEITTRKLPQWIYHDEFTGHRSLSICNQWTPSLLTRTPLKSYIWI